VRVLDLRAVAHRPIEAHGSRGFEIGAFAVAADTSMVMVRLRAGGVIGRHPAAGRQLLVVVEGDARVRGGDGPVVDLGPGEAAVWEPGEPHETRTTDGLVAMVVEGDLDVGTPGHVVDPGDV
jgi:quercetin dioxygenase-like cupin family protein